MSTGKTNKHPVLLVFCLGLFQGGLFQVQLFVSGRMTWDPPPPVLIGMGLKLGGLINLFFHLQAVFHKKGAASSFVLQTPIVVTPNSDFCRSRCGPQRIPAQMNLSNQMDNLSAPQTKAPKIGWIKWIKYFIFTPASFPNFELIWINYVVPFFTTSLTSPNFKLEKNAIFSAKMGNNNNNKAKRLPTAVNLWSLGSDPPRWRAKELRFDFHHRGPFWGSLKTSWQ